MRIIDLEVRHVQGRLREQGLEVILTDEARDHIITKGYNPDFGARPIRRSVEQLIEDPLAEELLRGSFKDKTLIHIRVRDDHLFFDSTAVPEAPAEPVGAGTPVAAGSASPAEGKTAKKKK